MKEQCAAPGRLSREMRQVLNEIAAAAEEQAGEDAMADDRLVGSQEDIARVLSEPICPFAEDEDLLMPENQLNTLPMRPFTLRIKKHGKNYGRNIKTDSQPGSTGEASL